MNFNGGSPQFIGGGGSTTFNNLTISNSTGVTLNQNGYVQGNWTNNGTFNAGTYTVNFNGTSAQTINGSNATTFYNLSTSNSAGVSLNRDISVANNLFNNGGLNVGTSTLTALNLSNMTGTFDAGNGSNPLTITGNFWNMAAGTFNANNRTLQFGGSWQNDGVFNAGTSTVTFNGTTGQQFIYGASATTFNNVAVSNHNAVHFDHDTTISHNFVVNSGGLVVMGPGVTLTIRGNFQNDGIFDVTNDNITVVFDGTTAQSIGSTIGIPTQPFKNLTINNSVGGVNLTQDLDVRGNLTNNGVFNSSGHTVSFGAMTSQTIGGSNPTTFDTLQTNVAGMTHTQSINVNVLLDLRSDMFTGSNTVNLAAGATLTPGDRMVFGKVRRTQTFVAGNDYAFNSERTIIRFNSGGTIPNDITITLTNTKPSGLTYAVERTYNVTQNGGSGFSALLELHYRDSELNGIDENKLEMWRFDGTRWVLMPNTYRDPFGNSIERNGVTEFSDWAISDNGAPNSVTLSSLTARGVKQTSYLVLLAMTGLSAAGIGALMRMHRR